MFAPADEAGPDTDGIHAFVRIPAGAYILRIATIGSPIQTLGHDVRSGILDTLTIGLRRGALCLHH
jgi:hypothetical protein